VRDIHLPGAVRRQAIAVRHRQLTVLLGVPKGAVQVDELLQIWVPLLFQT